MLVEAKQLNRSYSNGIELKNISFEIHEKGIYGFLGKDGSGKTELATLLAGIYDCDFGSLIYNGKEMFVSECQTVNIKRKIGYSSEKSFFDEDMTVFEILDFVGKAKQIDPDKRFRQIKEALELMGLSNKKATLVGELSLSEKKRLAIASALLGNPDVVILDEPLRYLDKWQSAEVVKLIKLLGTKKVVLMFSSRPSEIEQLCEYAAILSCGEIMLWDRVEDILNKMEANGGLGGLSDVLEAFTQCGEEE